ncbi:MAG: tetratricopeptide repeat protein [Porticoccaceae bacterium]
MSSFFNWLAEYESGLSALAALIAIIAGITVVSRLLWTRMPGQVKRPAFLSDWRNIGLICLAAFGLLLLGILTLSNGDSGTSSALSDISGKPSVAVLPLNNISGDPEQEYLADGIAEDVITLLSRNPRFFVIARNSSFTYKGKAVDIRQVGEALGVRYVVEGSLRKIGERLRVTIQLIDTNNGQHLWAEQYDRSLSEIFKLQDDITNGIAVALGDEIWRAEIGRANSTSTDNLDAWGLVMRANRALFSFSSQSTLEAVELLREALALDPDFPLAKAELARSLCWRAFNQFSEDPSKDIAEAYSLGKEVLQVAPNDPLVLYAVGACYSATGRIEEAIRLLEKAVAKQPNFALALGALSYSLTFDGQAEKSVSYGEQALRLSPQSPLIWVLESWRATGLNELGQYQAAEKALKNALKSYDGWQWTWVQMAWARAGLGDIEGARQALYNARKAEPQFSLALIKGGAAIAYKNKGKNLLAALEPIWPEDLKTANNE